MNTAPMPPSSVDWSMLSLADLDPFPSYDILRRRGAVVWDPGMNCWLVLSYEICKIVESDEATYRIPYEKLASPLWYEIKGGRTSVSVLTGEAHTRMRRLYLKLLSPAVMPRFRDEHVVPVINDAIDRFAEKGSAELVSQLTKPVPPRIMASLFGLPWRNDNLIANLLRWHDELVAWLNNKNDEGIARKARQASVELNNLFRPLVRRRREERGSDFISQVWSRAPEDWGEVNEDDVVSVVRDLELGAGDTTTNAITNSIHMFLSDPAVRERVTRDQEGALNAFVEEELRLFGALQWRFRVAHQDVSLGGAMIKKDDSICLVHAAANRDPGHYSCPHVVDLQRKPPTDHLAFNVGPRICPGMHLARLKMRECLKALIHRLPDLRFDSTKEAPRFRGLTPRAFFPLHVVF
ncbi:cytochrome P450 [Bradyrhizobium sp. USDA 4341]